jgi:hypothetical protein
MIEKIETAFDAEPVAVEECCNKACEEASPCNSSTINNWVRTIGLIMAN